jgi:hypothetical protein
MLRFAQHDKPLNTSNNQGKKSKTRSGEGYPPANRKEPHRNQNRKCNMIAKDCVDEDSRIEMKPNNDCYVTNRVPVKQPQSCASKSTYGHEMVSLLEIFNHAQSSSPIRFSSKVCFPAKARRSAMRRLSIASSFKT